MRQLVVVVLALLVATVTAKSLGRNAKLLERAILSRLVSGRSPDGVPESIYSLQDKCDAFLNLNEALYLYFGDEEFTEEQWNAFTTLFPEYEELWQSCIGESQEETASEEETESATSTPAPAPTEPTTESQESEATEPPASKRFLLEKLLRNVQLELKHSEAFKQPYHRRRK